MARRGQIELCISEPLLSEVCRVLGQKFRVTPEEIEETRTLSSSFTPMVEPIRHLDVINDDPTDDRVLECALASGSSAVVTGDSHLLRIGQYEGVEILKVSDFLNRG